MDAGSVVMLVDMINQAGGGIIDTISGRDKQLGRLATRILNDASFRDKVYQAAQRKDDAMLSAMTGAVPGSSAMGAIRRAKADYKIQGDQAKQEADAQVAEDEGKMQKAQSQEGGMLGRLVQGFGNMMTGKSWNDIDTGGTQVGTQTKQFADGTGERKSYMAPVTKWTRKESK